MDSKLIASIYEDDDSSEKSRRCADFMRGAIDLDFRKKKVLGVGFCPPLFSELEKSFNDTEFMILCPMQLGAFRWRGGVKQLNRTVLSDPELMPFADKEFDKVIIFEMFEYTNSIHNILRDAWRVLSDDGEIIIITRKNFNDFPRDDYVVATELGEGNIKKVPLSIIKKELSASIFKDIKSYHISKYNLQEKMGFIGGLIDNILGDHVITIARKQTYITTMIRSSDGKLIESAEYNV